jgi:hypothetical protein
VLRCTRSEAFAARREVQLVAMKFTTRGGKACLSSDWALSPRDDGLEPVVPKDPEPGSLVFVPMHFLDAKRRRLRVKVLEVE